MVKTFANQNYWAFVLGGSAGLGLASAKKLAAHGMNLIIIHRDRRSDVEDFNRNINDIEKSGVEVKSFNMDAMNAAKRENCIQEIQQIIPSNSKIRTLVHSIAKGNLKPMNADTATLKNDDFHLTIDAMAISLYDWVKALHAAKLFAEDARIISFTSAGNKKAWKGYAAVSAAKVVLESITRNIALEFAKDGITANCIQAGTVDTASFRSIPGSEKLKEQSLKANPFRCLTTAENVADAVLLLSMDEASWINGAIIPVDGGEHLS